MTPADSGDEELVALARAARTAAYAPYSGFRVGAALRCADGTVVTGCNVENGSYGLTSCAERNAVCAAVAGGRVAFSAVAVVGNGAVPVTPCGACRQVLAEFPARRDLRVVMAGEVGEARLVLRLEELLPVGFHLEDAPSLAGAHERPAGQDPGPEHAGR